MLPPSFCNSRRTTILKHVCFARPLFWTLFNPPAPAFSPNPPSPLSQPFIASSSFTARLVRWQCCPSLEASSHQEAQGGWRRPLFLEAQKHHLWWKQRQEANSDDYISCSGIRCKRSKQELTADAKSQSYCGWSLRPGCLVCEPTVSKSLTIF